MHVKQFQHLYKSQCITWDTESKEAAVGVALRASDPCDAESSSGI